MKHSEYSCLMFKSGVIHQLPFWNMQSPVNMIYSQLSLSLDLNCGKSSRTSPSPLTHAGSMVVPVVASVGVVIVLFLSMVTFLVIKWKKGKAKVK